MALPRDRQGTFTPAELYFFAEQETITIVPRLTLPKLRLVSYTPLLSPTSSSGGENGEDVRYGDGVIQAMRPNRRVKVPIWLAVLLKRQRRCTVEIPGWLHVDSLQRKVDEERGIVHRSAEQEFEQRRRARRRRRPGDAPNGADEDEDEDDRPGQGFSSLPLRWIEISDILLDACGDDFPLAPISALQSRSSRQRSTADGAAAANQDDDGVDSVSGDRASSLAPQHTTSTTTGGGSEMTTSSAQTVDLTRRLLRDLREIRQAKARQGLQLLGDEDAGPVLRMDRIGSYEVNEIRGLFGGTADTLRRLEETRRRADDDDDDDDEDRGGGGGGVDEDMDDD